MPRPFDMLRTGFGRHDEGGIAGEGKEGISGYQDIRGWISGDQQIRGSFGATGW